MMWSCKRCTFENGPESEECEVCQLPRSATGDDTESWQCVHCCQFSPTHSSCCTVCGERKQELHSGSPGRLRPAEGTAYIHVHAFFQVWRYPSLISLMVSVDIKHHVYLLRSGESMAEFFVNYTSDPNT